MSKKVTEDDFRYEYLDRQVEQAQAERKSKRDLERERLAAAKMTPQERAEHAKKRKHFWITVAVILVLGAIIMSTAGSVRDLIDEKARVENELSELEKKRDQLQSELKEVQSDEYVEQEARSELRMIFPGEKLFVLPQEEFAGQEEPEQEEESEDSED